MKCGLAFNAQPDRATPGYKGIPLGYLIKAVEDHWCDKLGHLLLFSVDHINDRFSIVKM